MREPRRCDPCHLGRDGGDYSFDFYMEAKNISVTYDTHKTPKIGT